MTEQTFRDFVAELKAKAPLFVRSMENEKTPGKYRLTLSGDIPSSDIDWGLGQTTFALRILYILNVLDNKTASDAAHFIKTFAHADGSFYDPYVARSTLIQRVLRTLKHRNGEYALNKPNKRAETRQAQAALLTLGESFKDYHTFDLAHLNIDRFFDRFDWCKPWAAASHINHLIFFTKYSQTLTETQKEVIYTKIHDNLSPYLQHDGIYKSNCHLTNNQKIGGLMKILMGLSLIGLDQKFVSTTFIDFALDKMVACNACENFNTLYVLYYCTKHLDYRKEDIKKFALSEAKNWLEYYYPKYGAFSFYQGKAQTLYYDAKVSKGLNEPDLHGTAMFVWGILIIAEILELDKALDLRHPIL